ncbi:MAG: TrmB family transcriptional regulator [Promethearchaeota archaeon]
MADNADEELKEKIIEDLQNLGFTPNDSKVYITLLRLGYSNPVKIAEISGVDRARVYDSLKRLIKKGIVEEQPIKRSPYYKAKDPNEVFERFRDSYKMKINLSKNLEAKLALLEKNKIEKPTIWALQNVQQIETAVHKLIDKARKKISLIITPDISENKQKFPKLIDKIISKKIESPKIEINVIFYIEINEDIKPILKRLYNHDISIYNWETGKVLPFGLYLSESSFILTILNNTEYTPKYGFGIIMENADEDMIDGFNHLVAWCLSNKLVTKKAVFVHKSGNTNAEKDIKQ